MRAVTRPVDGSIRSTSRGSTVQTDPSPTARFCAPTADGLAEKTFGIRSVTWPSGEICHSELPLRAHTEPKPATRFDGCGTSTERGPGAGVGELELVAADVGATDPDEPAGEDDVVVHAVSRTTIEQRYGATRMSRSSSPSSDRRVSFDGDFVRRPAYPWTTTVHALLRYLSANGFDAAPQPLGIADGVETLSFIPGESGPAGWAKIVPEDALRRFARFLRRYHDAAVGFEPPSIKSPWAFRSGAPGQDEVICHGDFGPWNVVWRGVEPIGLLDFDFAGPGDPMLDVAYALEYAAPFCDDEESMRWHAYPEPPDRRRRIEVFAEAYGLPRTDGLVDAVIDQQRLDIHRVRTLAARGFEPQRTWVRGGIVNDLEDRVRWSREHRGLFE